MAPALNGDPTRDDAKVMTRLDLTRRLVATLTQGEAVIAGIGNTNFDLWATGQRPQNFYMLGSMGLAVPIALGVAIAQPQRRVFALEGDGSILMQLGVLATVAACRAANLVIIVMDNGTYDITGGQPTATSRGADIVRIARGCGISDSRWATDESNYDHLIRREYAVEPKLIAIRIDATKPLTTTDRDPPRIRHAFMQGLRT